MSNIEFEGRTEQEAVQKACSALQLAEHQLDYTVIDEGSKGLFGVGSRPVRIRARTPSEERVTRENMRPTAAPAVPPPVAQSSGENDVEAGDEDDIGAGGVVGPAPEKAARALEVARGFAEKMGLQAKIDVRDEDTRIVIVIEENDGSTDVATMLGGSRPPAIPSFQFLLNKIVNRFPEGRKHILVEVPSVPRMTHRRAEKRPQENGVREGGNERAPRAPKELDPDLDPALVELGRLLAARAQELSKVITVHPMLPGDRRAIHQTITTINGVQTMSEGEGLYRRMHIVPDSLRGGAGAGSDGGRKRRRRRRRRRPGEAGGDRIEGEGRGGDDAGGHGDQDHGDDHSAHEDANA